MLVESYEELMLGDPSPACEGYLHSVETCGTVDGPGVRFVLFTTGCPLRCRYCHNPDTQRLKSGKKVTAGEIVEQVRRYRPFIKNGGLTISGGEPLSQQRFIESVFRDVKRLGLHTALDTSGCFGTRLRPRLLDEVDLVLLDLKSWGNARHRHLTGHSMEEVLAFAGHLETIRKPTWIRFVLVPGLTDDEAILNGIGNFAASLSNVELVEVLPFHKYGERKYAELQQSYTLTDCPEPTEAQVERVRSQFRSFGLKVR
jgi:pyruvate formate lyase activating enzyme